LAWGVHAVLCHEVVDVLEMTDLASRTVLKEHFGEPGQSIVISAGLPFTVAGTTNLVMLDDAGKSLYTCAGRHDEALAMSWLPQAASAAELRGVGGHHPAVMASTAAAFPASPWA